MNTMINKIERPHPLEPMNRDDLIKESIVSQWSILDELVGDFRQGANLRDYAAQITDGNLVAHGFNYRIMLATRKAFWNLKSAYDYAMQFEVDLGLYKNRIEKMLNNEELKKYIER